MMYMYLQVPCAQWHDNVSVWCFIHMYTLLWFINRCPVLSGTDIVSVMMKLYIKLELPLCAFASLLLSDNSEKERQVSQQAFWLISYNFHFYLPTCKSVLNIQYIHVHLVRLLYILLNFHWFFFQEFISINLLYTYMWLLA